MYIAIIVAAIYIPMLLVVLGLCRAAARGDGRI